MLWDSLRGLLGFGGVLSQFCIFVFSFLFLSPPPPFPSCRFHVVASTLSLPRCRFHVVASTLSLPSCRFHVVASTLLLVVRELTGLTRLPLFRNVTSL